jgi:hypothetical protein
MTDAHIEALHREMHELKLLGTPTPRESVMADNVTQLINEVRRLRRLAFEAISFVREQNPTKADALQELIDWEPQGPV